MSGSAGARPGWDELGSPSDDLAMSSWVGDGAADVVVVGLGASGLEACRHLATRGLDVVGLDAVGIAAGAAGRNGGFLLAGGARFHDDAVDAWGRELAVALYRASERELDRVVDQHPDLVVRTGSLRIAADTTEARAIARQLEVMQADGLAVEPYDGPEGSGLRIPDDAHVQPVSRCRDLARRAVSAGARLHAPAPVTDLRPGQVTTPDGSLRARHVIVAVDGGIEAVLPELAGRVRTARLQMLATAPTDAVGWTQPIYRRGGLDYLLRLASGEVLLGGGRDLGGDSEWGAAAEPSAPVQAHLEGLLDLYGIDTAVTHRWAGRSAFTSDRLPICEEVRPGIVAVGAYSGHGNLLGTLLARRAASALLDGRAISLRGALTSG